MRLKNAGEKEPTPPMKNQVHQLRNHFKKKRFSAIYDNGDFTNIFTKSGDKATFKDPSGPEYWLLGNASDETIGAALMNCLSHSRFLPYQENSESYNLQDKSAEYEEWIQTIMEKYKYTSKRAALSGLDFCSVESVDHRIFIKPFCHVKPGVWVRRTTDMFEDVVIPDTSSPGEIGKAVRLGISRCYTE